MKYLVFVLLVGAACASEVEKREAEPSTGYLYPPYGSHHSTHYHAGRYHPLHKRSAEPEAEAEPSNLYYPSYSTNYHYGYSSYHLHKRSADPVAEAEPSYGHIHSHHDSYTPNHHTYTPYVNHPHKRSAEPSTIYHPYYTPYNPYVRHPHKRSVEANPSYHHAYDTYHYHGVTTGHGFHYRY